MAQSTDKLTKIRHRELHNTSQFASILYNILSSRYQAYTLIIVCIFYCLESAWLSFKKRILVLAFILGSNQPTDNLLGYHASPIVPGSQTKS